MYTPSFITSPCSATRTGRRELLARIAGKWLFRYGARCWTITMVAGRSAGRLPRIVLIAWMPPADATSAMSHGGDSRLCVTTESDDIDSITPIPSAASACWREVSGEPMAREALHFIQRSRLFEHMRGTAHDLDL